MRPADSKASGHSEGRSGPCHSEERSVPCHSEERGDEEAGHATPERGAYADDLYCPECGYSLRGLTSERCPECGMSLERVEALGWQIAWVHRRRVGRWRGYWSTARRAAFRGNSFFRDVPRIVDYPDAQRFRWITVGIFAVTVFLIIVAYSIASQDVRDELAVNGWFHGVRFIAGILGLAALTGLPSYLFHPRHLSTEEQDRAIAMSYYACAPLAFVSWTLPLYALATLFAMADRKDFDSPPWLAVGASMIAVALWWLQLVRLGRACFRTRWAKVRVALLVPLLWIFVGGLVVVGLPWLTLYVAALLYAVG
jgi:rubredoxin